MVATWADRDLAIAGRVFIADPMADQGRRAVLVNSSNPVCRITTLAIHLNRKVNDEGLKFNKHKHLSPLVGQLDHLVAEGHLLESAKSLLAEKPPRRQWPRYRLEAGQRISDWWQCCSDNFCY